MLDQLTCEEITSYSDNEVSITEDCKGIENKINTDLDFLFEFSVQKKIKVLLTERFSNSHAPCELSAKIKSKALVDL